MYSDFYEILLPALHFEKVEETHREVNDTEENYARPHQKYKAKNVTKDDIQRSLTATQVKTTRKQTHTLPKQRNADRKRMSISAFKIMMNRNTK